MENLDIVNLIERNPLTRLSKLYQNKFVERIKTTFTETQQQLFVSSFYLYLNYNSKTDFVINIDDVWKWLGFARRDNCKRVLQKHFAKDVDYKIDSRQPAEKSGRPYEHIMLNTETFKTLCLLVSTDKGKDIRKYYMQLEELLQDMVNEESAELRNQLQVKQSELESTRNSWKQKAS